MISSQKKYLNNLLIGKKAEKYSQFDKKFEIIAVKMFQAERVQLPSLINPDILIKLGYFETHSNQLSRIGSFKQVNFNNQFDKDDPNNFFLTPAGCLPIYPEIANHKEKFPFSVTALCQVYRYENGNWDKTHLWEFHCREIIFFGDKEYVSNSFKKLEKIIINYASDNKIVLEKKLADDLFFQEAEQSERKAKILKNLQKNMELKYELCYKNSEEKDIALASFNFHNFHFSKIFGWDNNEEIVSGCVGFGLERWVNAWYDSKQT